MVTNGNPRRDPRTGRFVGRFASRRTLRQLADLPDEEWDLDEEATAILARQVERAIQDGWTPPAGSEAGS